ncbi:MAG TPA: SDR family oxidoreductase [Pelagibacterium sp.]|uniref:SDR family oxidoreductase n=1 Tax=Pelagibacterium sp. TaxID=1967288 RepID=UPI002C7393F9|nr:SDR family oxidoreductase [Pelagibacterium sp.]HWJ87104.1 SDR family oxidoreductase [Pelagibacterium sp.]
MDLEISGRTALVTAGGGGLGRAIALRLAAEGATVVAADINQEAAEATRAAIVDAGGKAMGLQWDMGDLSLVEQRIAQIERDLAPVDILVNISGGPAPSLSYETKAEDWIASFQSMVASTIAITNRVLPGMRRNRWGRVVTSSSSGVIAPIPNLAVSNALRASLLAWSKTLAAEVAADNVTANIVIPGRVATARIRFLDEAKAARENRSIDDVIAQSTTAIPMRRYGEPEEYADAVAFLASNRASYITGTVLRIDGGYIASV